MKKLNLFLITAFALLMSINAKAYTVELDPGTPLNSYISLGEWNIDGDFEDWTTNTQIIDATVSGGNFNGIDDGNDPIMNLNIGALTSPDSRVGHATATGTIFEIRMQFATNSGNTRTELFAIIGGIFRVPPLQFADNANPALPDIPVDGAFHVFRITLGIEDTNYLGSLDGARFDPLADWGPTGETFKVDYFRIANVITTIKVDPIPLVNYTSLAEWNTDGDFEGWQLVNIGSSNVLGGIMSGIPLNGDPHFYKMSAQGLLQPNLSSAPIVEFRLKQSVSYTSEMEIFYGTTDNPGISGERRVVIPQSSVPADGNFHVYQYNMSTLADWNSDLEAFRIDPYVNDGAIGLTFEIDYIRVGSTETPTVNPSATQGTYPDKVVVSWDEVDNANKYQVWRSTTDDSGTAITNSPELTTNVFDDTTASPDTYYYYWVKAFITNEWGNFGNSALGFKMASTKPDTPVNISPVSLNTETAPVTLLATPYFDSGGYPFLASQWQLSSADDFTSIIWDSGNTLAINHFTPPANASSSITNYWRCRYRKEFNTWSDWSDGTSYILIPLPEQSVIFSDTFNVPGSGDANNEYDYPCRQTGNSAPLTYKTEGDTKTGGSSSESGWLTLGQSSGCSPNHSFTESGNFKIEFDVKPDMLNGTTDWASISFGKSSQDDFFPVSVSGLANIFYSHGWMHTYSGETMVGNTFGIPIAEELHVMITVGTEDFESEEASISTFINDQPFIADSTTLANLSMPLYAYVRSGGFYDNYIALYNNGTVSTEPSVFDNFSITPAPESVKSYHWTGDADSLVNSSKTYTHKINLNDADVTINSVTFNGTGFNPGIYGNGDPMISTSTWALTASGAALAFFDGEPASNFVGGASTDLAKHFAFPHGSFAFNLSGLEPFSSNTFYVYTIGFEAGIREGRFSSSYGGAISNINQDLYDVGGGLIITYDYVASKEGKFCLAITPANLHTNNTACFHVSGFANEKTGEPNPETVVDCIINFGDVAVGDNKILPMEIENAGGGTVFGTITGDALPFSLDTNVYSATAATSDVINIDFVPDTEIVYTNVISLIGNDGTTQVMLTGTGVPEPSIFIIYNLLFAIYYFKIKK